MRLVYFAQMMFEIFELMDSGVDVGVTIIGEIWGLHLDCFSDIIRHGLVTLSEVSAKRKIHVQTEVVGNIKRKKERTEEEKKNRKRVKKNARETYQKDMEKMMYTKVAGFI